MKPPLGFVYICLHRGESIVSRLIRWQTRGDYSHASLLLPDGRHVEAREFKGVVVHDRFTAPNGELVELFAIPVTLEQVDAIAKMVEAEKDSGYDYRAVWAFVTRRTPKGASETRWFCSEFVFALLKAAGILLFARTEAWEVSPSLLPRSPIPTYAGAALRHPLAA